MTALVRDRLAALRDAHGLTDVAMARAAHQRQQDVSRFFLGQMKKPALDFMDALCRVVNTTLAEILASESPKYEMPEWASRVVAGMKALDPSDRHAFERLIHRRTAGDGSGRPRARRANRSA